MAPCEDIGWMGRCHSDPHPEVTGIQRAAAVCGRKCPVRILTRIPLRAYVECSSEILQILGSTKIGWQIDSSANHQSRLLRRAGPGAHHRSYNPDSGVWRSGVADMDKPGVAAGEVAGGPERGRGREYCRGAGGKTRGLGLGGRTFASRPMLQGSRRDAQRPWSTWHAARLAKGRLRQTQSIVR